jgi:hypothetical protein
MQTTPVAPAVQMVDIDTLASVTLLACFVKLRDAGRIT